MIKLKVGDKVLVKRQGSFCNTDCGRCLVGEIMTIKNYSESGIWIWEKAKGGCSAFSDEDLELLKSKEKQ